MTLFRSLLAASAALALSAAGALAQAPAPSSAPLAAAPASGPASGDMLKQAIRQSFAVVDVQYILRESKAAKSVQGQVEGQQKKYQEQINAEEGSLRTAQEQLQRQQSVLAPEAFAQKRKEFEGKVAQVQQSVRTKKQDLEAAFAQGVKRINDQVVAIVGKMAEERKLIAVFPRNQVLLVESSLDLTKEVMDKLNQQLPSVTVNVVGASKAAAAR
jgi:outer membrane protein